MATKWQKFKIDLSGYSSTEREAIALEVIDRIIKRSKSGVDRNGDKFPKLTKQYSKYKREIAGSGASDLTLTGDMLDSIEILSNNSKSVLIGYKNGSTENGKADGNIRGTYGSNTPNPQKARDFLGVSESELNKILNKYPKGEEISKERAVKKLLTEESAARLSGAVDTDDLEDDG